MLRGDNKMIFETLHEAAKRGELILVYGGLCHYHVCTRGDKKGQLTIGEIIVIPEMQGRGTGTFILFKLREVAQNHNCNRLLAKCPADLPANGWYKKRLFELVGTEKTKTGRVLNVWVLKIPQNVIQHGANKNRAVTLPMIGTTE